MANSLEVGMIIEGKVLQIKPFGAFIALPENKKGLVHISHISHSYIKDVSDVLHEGDSVKVKILSMESNGKISLSIKEAMPKPSQPEKRNFTSEEDRSFPKKDSEKGSSKLEELLKEWTRQSNDRHTDINRRLKR